MRQTKQIKPALAWGMALLWLVVGAAWADDKPAARGAKAAAKKDAKGTKKDAKGTKKDAKKDAKDAKKGAKDAKGDAKPDARGKAPAKPRLRRPAPVRPRPPRTKAERIVEKMVVAIGGREAWALVRNTRATGVTKLTTMMGTRSAKLLATNIRPGYQRVDMEFNGQKVIQSHHPKGGWISQNGSIFQLPRSMSEMTKAETARAELELRYATEKINVKYLRSRKIRGKMCDVIVFIDDKGNRTTYYITSDTHMLLKRTYVGPSPLGTGKKRFSTYHGDFRWVRVGKGKHKVKMPFRVENYIGGRKIGLIQLKTVVVNDKTVTKQSFLPPNPTE